MVAYLESFLPSSRVWCPSVLDTRIDTGKLYDKPIMIKKLAAAPETAFVDYIVCKLQAWSNRFSPKPVDFADKAEQAPAAAEAAVEDAAVNCSATALLQCCC